jgi:hypothetical protein
MPEAVRGRKNKCDMVINDKKVTSQGQGNLNTVLGSVGAAGALFGNGWLQNILGGLGGGNRCCNAEDMPVSRYEANMMNLLATKDAEIALLQADKYTDQKIVEAYKDLNGQINALAMEVRANKDAQADINREQAVYNGVNTATLQCLQSQVAQLFGLTKLVVPNGSVCPGWGSVTVTPATAPTTVAG